MESVVGKLLDVDREARMLLDEAQQYYDKTVEEIAGEKKRMRADYEQRAQKHLDDVQKAEAHAAEEVAAEILERYGRLTAAVGEVCERGREEWEDELYKRCVTRKEIHEN